MTTDHTVIRAGSLRATTTLGVERIGRVGEFWATHFATGWALFVDRIGCVDDGLTRDEAERALTRYETTRTIRDEGATA